MRKLEVLLIISVSSLLNNVICQTKPQSSKTESTENEKQHNRLLEGNFEPEFLYHRTEATILKRIARQTGYNYDKPKVPFNLPSGPTEAAVPVTPRPIPVPSPPQSPAGDYSYPSPSPQSSGPASPAQGYDSPQPAAPASPAPKQDDSYNYNAPPSIESSSDTKQQSKEDYSYNPPTNPINEGGPSPQAPEVVVSSTGGPTYLPPKPGPGPTSSPPAAGGYEAPIKSVQLSVPSSTPGQPYLPPTLDSPRSIPQTSYDAPIGGFPSRPSNPTSNYIPPVKGNSSPSSATPPRGPDPAKISNSYLAPRGSPSKPRPPNSSYGTPVSSPSKPSSPGNSYIPPTNPKPPGDTYIAPSNPKSPGDTYIPPSPSGFQPSQPAPSPSQSISTPANSYLPPYN